jgi:hypothetical protein
MDMDAEDEESWLRDHIMREEARESMSGAESESEFLDFFHQLAGQAQRPAAGWNPSGEIAARATTLKYDAERVQKDMAAAGASCSSSVVPPAAPSALALSKPRPGLGLQKGKAKCLEELMALLPLQCCHANGIEERLDLALNCSALHFSLCHPKALEGKVQENALRWMRQSSQAFKIGITIDPFHRWSNEEYGYSSNRVHDTLYRTMVVLYVSSDATAVGMLEAALITIGRVMHPGRCRNVANGGEAKKQASVHFAYIVFA